MRLRGIDNNKAGYNNLGAIIAGGGYSTDSQQVTSEMCYNATASVLSGQTSSLELDTAQSFLDIQKESRMSIDVKGGVGMFSASAQASYLNSMEDKEYSMSLNYFSYAYATASVQIAWNGLDALTATGKSFYNNGTNPYFGLVCGDQYITSYDAGAMLLMGINIDFSSKYQKEQFNAHIGASFGNIFSAAGEVSQTASQFGISGSVTIQATQTGGDPSQLSHILSKNGNGDYYALTCSLSAMSDCISAASGMLDYARNDFPTQFSFKDNTGLTPLGAGFMKYNPIYYIGLTPPQSLVTKEVLDDRYALADAYEENQYYEENLYGLINGYPVAWDTTSNVYKGIQNLHQRAQNNIATILNPGDQDSGALGCFDHPEQCSTITQNIKSNLVPITANDLSVLQPIQYILPASFVNFYFSGSTYGFVSNTPSYVRDVFNNMYTFTLTETTYSSIVHFCGFNNNCDIHKETACYSATSSDGIHYSGTAYTFQNNGVGVWTDHCTATTGPVSYSKTPSPFYFEAYNGTDSDMDLAGEALFS